MSDKIELKEKILAVDLGSRSLWDEMDETQQKALKGELFILNRYISNVKTNNREQMESYVLSVNELYNKHWFTLQKHPKLLWQLLCLCNFDKKTTFYHEWIGLGKKHSNKKHKLLNSIYSNMKTDEIELLIEMTPDDELKELARELGWEEKEIKDI
jgi:hypothetical protein